MFFGSHSPVRLLAIVSVDVYSIMSSLFTPIFSLIRWEVCAVSEMLMFGEFRKDGAL